MSASENFAGYPPSIGELRSDHTQSSSDWAPRDALISVLREIDEDLDVDALVVCYRHRDDAGKLKSRFRAASPDGHVTLGMLTSTIHKMQD